MEPYEAIFEKIKNEVIIPEIKFRREYAVEMVCYEAIKKIQTIVHDDSLPDEECFMKVEEIICVLEEIGLHGGSRHDFG
ncbi:MAG: hypothetical protein KBS74_03410 [Clostridiales bacterium]|nr:hypothetical protein [Candidatus Cacconaster stercorequi]